MGMLRWLTTIFAGTLVTSQMPLQPGRILNEQQSLDVPTRSSLLRMHTLVATLQVPPPRWRTHQKQRDATARLPPVQEDSLEAFPKFKHSPHTISACWRLWGTKLNHMNTATLVPSMTLWTATA